MRSVKGILLVLLGFAIVLGGCGEVSQEQAVEKKEPEPPPEPVDGQTAFFRMFPAARGWSPDAQGLRLESFDLEEVPADGAKFGAWRATFYSPSKRSAVVFNYSVVDVGGKVQKGVFQDHEESFNPGRASPWIPTALKTSSEKVLEVAMAEQRTKDYLAKNPDKPMFILLEQTKRHPNLAWRVVWGDSVSRSDFSVFVDASTGDFREVMR